MKKIITILSFVALIVSGCNRAETIPENPLTDLPWLKEKIDEINFLVEEGQITSVGIYQCSYDHGKVGFLEDHVNIAYFYNSKGKTLCIMGTFTGITCEEFDIVSKELIWDINYPKEKPIKHEAGEIPTPMEYSVGGTSFLWTKLNFAY